MNKIDLLTTDADNSNNKISDKLKLAPKKKNKLPHTLSSINRQALLFFAVSLLVLTLSRLATFFVFSDWQAVNQFTSKLDDLFITGLRFDLKVISLLLLLFVYLPALIFLWFDKWNTLSRWVSHILLLCLLGLVILGFVDFGFHIFFGNPIDVLIFSFFEDHALSIVSSITEDWRLVSALVACAILLILLTLYYRKVDKHHASNHNTEIPEEQQRGRNTVFVLISIIILSGFSRGSFDTFPLSRKNSSISHSSFLNSLVMNGPLHLFYASKDLRKYDIFTMTSDDLLKKANAESIDELIKKSGFDNSNNVSLNQAFLLKRTTPKNDVLAKNPPHVIFVQMEGWSTHIAQEHSEDNQVLAGFTQHADEDHYYPNFFSNSNGTNSTIERILLNSPVTPVSQSGARKTHFGLSNALPYQRKGYDTLFLSGGFATWRNHSDFWTLQGFDRYIDRTEIEEKYNIDSNNPRGVYEEYLFEYLKVQLLNAEKNKKPLFSFVMTTNNHPPVRLPKHYSPPPLNPEHYGFSKDNSNKQSVLTGFSYQSQSLGDFLTWLKQSGLSEKVIVVATGDHTLKGFSDYSSTKMQYLRYAVATYFYIPKALDKLTNVSTDIRGSHIDLFPTLFEMSLSEAEYYAFGVPLMEKTLKQSFAWSETGVFLFDEGLVDAKTNTLFDWKKGQKKLLDDKPNDVSDYQQTVIEQQKNRTWLQLWLLLDDFEKGK